MTIAAPPSGLQPEDYEEIEAAVMETARGRWFLAEYARRVRSAESERMLAAIERLEARLEARHALAPAEAFSVAERLSELAWTLRERGVEDFVCSKIDALAREFEGVSALAQQCAAPAEASPVSTATFIEPPIAEAPTIEPVIEAPTAPAVLEPIVIAAETRGPEPERPAIDPRLAALSWLDRLPLVDRMALFA